MTTERTALRSSNGARWSPRGPEEVLFPTKHGGTPRTLEPSAATNGGSAANGKSPTSAGWRRALHRAACASASDRICRRSLPAAQLHGPVPSRNIRNSQLDQQVAYQPIRNNNGNRVWGQFSQRAKVSRLLAGGSRIRNPSQRQARAYR